MRLSDLQVKDVVSIKDGRRIGRIIDVEINEEGKILFLIIEAKKGFRNLVSSGIDSSVTFSQITKIGEDVILVDI